MTHPTALITGASSGIGRAVAVNLAKQGFKLVLLARRKERLRELSESLVDFTRCHVIPCDVRNSEALSHAMTQLPAEFAEVDVLINNAGLALGLAAAQQASWQDWQTMIETNCTALAFVTHLILPGMVARDRGHVINIGSIAGSYAYPGGNVYGATKAFVAQFTTNLKADLVGTSVRVTNIEPGLTSGSEFSLVRFGGDQQKADMVYAGTQPLMAEDIANSVAWVIQQPPHVNINRIEIMPTCQASAGFKIKKEK